MILGENSLGAAAIRFRLILVMVHFLYLLFSLSSPVNQVSQRSEQFTPDWYWKAHTELQRSLKQGHSLSIGQYGHPHKIILL